MVENTSRTNKKNPSVLLRDVTGADLPTFFEHQLDPTANYMAAFTVKDPADRQAFNAHYMHAPPKTISPPSGY